MKYVLAVLQILLGLQFIFVGGNKVITPVAQLAEQWAWVAAVPPFSVPVILFKCKSLLVDITV